MITLITGAPGTGKSNALVSMLAMLGRERELFVFGIPDLKIKHEPLLDPTLWPEVVPDGSVVILDEVQNVWRPRGPGQKVPDHVSKLETHRHRGLDFYVITQGPNLVDSNVRALVGRHVHLRDLGILGRWWYEWPECADNCRTGWKNAPIKKRYRLDKVAQTQYKSASIHVKPIRSIPWMLAVMVLALLLTVVMGWKAYSMIQGKMHPQPVVKIPVGGTGARIAASKSSALPSPSAAAISSGPRVLDDRVDWIPRLSGNPATAPAYDHLRVVISVPKIVGGVLMGKRARCFTQQGTDAGISEADCRAWMLSPPFDAFKLPTPVAVPPGAGSESLIPVDPPFPANVLSMPAVGRSAARVLPASALPVVAPVVQRIGVAARG